MKETNHFPAPNQTAKELIRNYYDNLDAKDVLESLNQSQQIDNSAQILGLVKHWSKWSPDLVERLVASINDHSLLVDSFKLDILEQLLSLRSNLLSPRQNQLLTSLLINQLALQKDRLYDLNRFIKNNQPLLEVEHLDQLLAIVTETDIQIDNWVVLERTLIDLYIDKFTSTRIDASIKKAKECWRQRIVNTQNSLNRDYHLEVEDWQNSRRYYSSNRPLPASQQEVKAVTEKRQTPIYELLEDIIIKYPDNLSDKSLQRLITIIEQPALLKVFITRRCQELLKEDRDVLQDKLGTKHTLALLLKNDLDEEWLIQTLKIAIREIKTTSLAEQAELLALINQAVSLKLLSALERDDLMKQYLDSNQAKPRLEKEVQVLCWNLLEDKQSLSIKTVCRYLP